jgi:hypothetical protein
VSARVRSGARADAYGFSYARLGCEDKSKFDALTARLDDVTAYVNIWHRHPYFGPWVCADVRQIIDYLDKGGGAERGNEFLDLNAAWEDRQLGMLLEVPDHLLEPLGYLVRSRAWAAYELDVLIQTRRPA